MTDAPQFRRCSLAGAEFDDVNLAEARFTNVNLAGAKLENVIEDDLAHGDLPDPSRPDHPCPRRREDGEAVQRALGSKLLEDADRRVGDQHTAEQRVLRGTHREDEDEQASEKRVERGEHV